jgi:hypothetical protein
MQGGLAGDVLSQAGLRHGVAPVALPTPSADRFVATARELVTADRPFDPRLIYVTDAALWPALGAWLAAIATLAWAVRKQAREALSALRARWIAPGSADAATSAQPPEAPAAGATPAE